MKSSVTKHSINSNITISITEKPVEDEDDDEIEMVEMEEEDANDDNDEITRPDPAREVLVKHLLI
jgi:hypothetical protein